MDFAQDGEIATLHRLADRPDGELENDLVRWTAKRPLTLVIPCLYSELDGAALDPILDELARVPYLDEVVIGLDRADADQQRHAREFFARLPQPHRVLWNDGPRLRQLEAELREHRIAPAPAGKGRNVWWCLGYVLGKEDLGAVALQDADIIGYDRSMLARLAYPVLEPTFGYVFSKGYYVRTGEGRLQGRVARLLVAPLLRALRSVIGQSPYLDYLGSFRYPLAGEVAMRGEAVAPLRVPADWGLEIGMLGELYRTHRTSQICQVDIADAYDHKHQDLSGEDPAAGLHRMAIDIANAVYKRLALDGQVLSTDHFRSLRAAFQRTALELIDRYHDDAVMNGLVYDRHGEVETVEVFARAVAQASDRFLADPLDAPFLPSWARVQSAVPDIHERIAKAVDADADA